MDSNPALTNCCAALAESSRLHAEKNDRIAALERELAAERARLDWLINTSNHAENGWLSEEAWDEASEFACPDDDSPTAYMRAAIDAKIRAAALAIGAVEPGAV